MNRRFDLLIFDWDGTLVDSIDWIVACLQTAAEEAGMAQPAAAAARSVIGLSSVHDSTMAANAGIAFVGVTCGADNEEALAAKNPLACVPLVFRTAGNSVNRRPGATTE